VGVSPEAALLAVVDRWRHGDAKGLEFGGVSAERPARSPGPRWPTCASSSAPGSPVRSAAGTCGGCTRPAAPVQARASCSRPWRPRFQECGRVGQSCDQCARRRKRPCDPRSDHRAWRHWHAERPTSGSDHATMRHCGRRIVRTATCMSSNQRPRRVPEPRVRTIGLVRARAVDDQAVNGAIRAPVSREGFASDRAEGWLSWCLRCGLTHDRLGVCGCGRRSWAERGYGQRRPRTATSQWIAC
jgi:hypothetical protein